MIAEAVARRKADKEAKIKSEDARRQGEEAARLKAEQDVRLKSATEKSENLPQTARPSVSYLGAISKSWVNQAAYLESLEASSNTTVSKDEIKASSKQKGTAAEAENAKKNSLLSNLFAGPSPDAWEDSAQKPEGNETKIELRSAQEAAEAAIRQREDERAAARARAEAREWEKIQKQLEAEAEQARRSRERDEKAAERARERARELEKTAKKSKEDRNKPEEELRQPQNEDGVPPPTVQSDNGVFSLISKAFSQEESKQVEEKKQKGEAQKERKFPLFGSTEKVQTTPTPTPKPPLKGGVKDKANQLDLEKKLKGEPRMQKDRKFPLFGSSEKVTTPSPTPKPPLKGAVKDKANQLDLFGWNKQTDVPGRATIVINQNRKKSSVFGWFVPADRMAPREEEKPINKVVEKSNIFSFLKKIDPPTLSMWTQNEDGAITGFISNSEEYRTGTKISTSPMKASAKAGTIVQTTSGSRYRLGLIASEDSPGEEESKKASPMVTAKKPGAQSSGTESKKASPVVVGKNTGTQAVGTESKKASPVVAGKNIGTQAVGTGKKSATSSADLRKKDDPNLAALYKWTQNADGSITGFVKNKKGFEDGTKIQTSAVKRGAKPGTVVVTAGGSSYKLL